MTDENLYCVHIVKMNICFCFYVLYASPDLLLLLFYRGFACTADFQSCYKEKPFAKMTSDGRRGICISFHDKQLFVNK